MQVEDRAKHSIHFPVPDDFIDLITHVVKQISVAENEYASGSEINHFIHQHPLNLSAAQNTDDFCSGEKLPTSKDLKNGEICEVCVRLIASASFFYCLDCKFFIHKCCAELPSQIQHPFHHDHPIILLQRATNEFADSFLCNACQNTSNGFAYYCASCGFYLDVFCSFLSDTLVYELHHHPLVLNQEPRNLNCNACHKPPSGVLYGCAACGFNLDIQCFSFPRLVRHRYDNHPVKLTYLPVESN